MVLNWYRIKLKTELKYAEMTINYNIGLGIGKQIDITAGRLVWMIRFPAGSNLSKPEHQFQKPFISNFWQCQIEVFFYI